MADGTSIEDGSVSYINLSGGYWSGAVAPVSEANGTYYVELKGTTVAPITVGVTQQAEIVSTLSSRPGR